MFGANVDYLVPNRFEYGYGLTPEIVELAATRPSGPPDLLMTVDNGIASHDGVAARLGAMLSSSKPSSSSTPSMVSRPPGTQHSDAHSTILAICIEMPAGKSSMAGMLAKMPVSLAEPEFATVIGMVHYGYRARVARGFQGDRWGTRLKALLVG